MDVAFHAEEPAFHRGLFLYDCCRNEGNSCRIKVSQERSNAT
jgi:hypothetical protein